MQLFKWSKMHEVFIPEIDAEHRNICGIGSDLHKAVLAAAPPERVSTLLRNLLDAAETHFEHEEHLMRDASFPSLAWHKREHDTVRRRAQACVQRIEAGDNEARVELLTFLSGWLQDHTGVADRMMGAYLRNWRRRERALAS